MRRECLLTNPLDGSQCWLAGESQSRGKMRAYADEEDLKEMVEERGAMPYEKVYLGIFTLSTGGHLTLNIQRIPH